MPFLTLPALRGNLLRGFDPLAHRSAVTLPGGDQIPLREACLRGFDDFPVLGHESEVTQSCPTLCNPMDCSLPGSSLHGILQARVLEWVSISYVCKDETKKLA